MKRVHIHVGVKDLEPSIKFYNALFDAEPSKIESDYAKWMLDEPGINFAISTQVGKTGDTHMGKTGVQHLGLQVDDEGELAVIRQRLANADMSVFDEGETQCCYAHSDKTWVEDPVGVKWEAFRSMENESENQKKNQKENQKESGADSKSSPPCCSPDAPKQSACCG